jgi:hypothetical protein
VNDFERSLFLTNNEQAPLAADGVRHHVNNRLAFPRAGWPFDDQA